MKCDEPFEEISEALTILHSCLHTTVHCDYRSQLLAATHTTCSVDLVTLLFAACSVDISDGLQLAIDHEPAIDSINLPRWRAMWLPLTCQRVVGVWHGSFGLVTFNHAQRSYNTYITRYTSHHTHHASHHTSHHITPHHTSQATHPTSHVTYHTSHITHHLQAALSPLS